VIGNIAALHGSANPADTQFDGLERRDLLDAGRSGVLSRELGFGRTKVRRFGSSSGRRRCLPILERFPSEDAERVAGNKMALNVERVMDDGVNG
jgi:hypothetical protein